MKIKTSELTGPALDWAVGVSEGKLSDLTVFGGSRTVWYGRVTSGYVQYWPSESWAQGGPIVEREDISFRKYHRPDSPAHGTYYARVCRDSGTMIGWHKTTGAQQTGPTPLIAAMRCYVASKLGDEVDVPEELV